jgi:hypothetical protein
MPKKDQFNETLTGAQGPHELLEKFLRQYVVATPERKKNDQGPSPKHITLNMDAGLHHRLKIFCAKKHTNVSSMVGDLVAAHLAKYDAWSDGSNSSAFEESERNC